MAKKQAAKKPRRRMDVRKRPVPRRTRRTAPTKAEQRADQDRFLAAYEAIQTVSGAARATTIGRRTHYDWLAHDDEYARRFAEADVVAIDKLEEEARRRALAGVNEPVFYQGKIVGHVARKSDTLLIFLLKGKRPEIYTERHEHTGAHGQAIRVASTALDLTTLSTEDLETLERLLARATPPRAGHGPHGAR